MTEIVAETVDTGNDIFENISRVIGQLQCHPDPQVREQLDSLLEGIDTVHRTALSHLFNQTVRPVVRTLLRSRLLASIARTRVRAKLPPKGLNAGRAA